MLTTPKGIYMKKLFLQIFFFCIIIILFFPSFANAQKASKFGIGGNLGGGFISGVAASQGSFFSSIYIDFLTPFSDYVYPRISFIYSQDFNSLLPGTRSDYFPFVKGISVKAVTSQPVSGKMYLEESIGLLYLNDRTISGTNDDNYGVSFSLTTGFDFRNLNGTGFRLGVGSEFGQTFNNGLAQFLSVYFQTLYSI